MMFILSACETAEEKSERIAKKYCSSCHVFPDPSLLDKKTWKEGVLPEMAFRMGVDYGPLQNVAEDELPEVLKALPSQQMVSDEEWNLIQEYYAENAPDSIKALESEPLPAITQFTGLEHALAGTEYPQVTLLKYDSASKKLFVGIRSRMLHQLNSDFTTERSVELHSPPSDIIVGKNNLLLTCMGVMDPNDKFAGRLIEIKPDNEWHTVLADSLKRPVNVQMADLNNDKQADYTISTFGHYTGALLVFERSGDSLKRHVIYSLPGTRKTIIRDFNNDGLNDILALITQGDEQILLLINQGKFKFRPQLLLRFPPVYGSSYFDICDFNKDGNFDILYTNGDNADFSSVLKPYHGIRIFLNDGGNQFSEDWFYHMPGASQALARDFDKDGDLDIAAISFFPDFEHHPEQGFIYFENQSGKFSASSTPLAASGRWLVMEAADIDSDNDIDLLLGAMNFPTLVPPALFEQWNRKGTSILVMKNNFRSE
jgi:hypothetical protein